MGKKSQETLSASLAPMGGRAGEGDGHQITCRASGHTFILYIIDINDYLCFYILLSPLGLMTDTGGAAEEQEARTFKSAFIGAGRGKTPSRSCRGMGGKITKEKKKSNKPAQARISWITKLKAKATTHMAESQDHEQLPAEPHGMPQKDELLSKRASSLPSLSQDIPKSQAPFSRPQRAQTGGKGALGTAGAVVSSCNVPGWAGGARAAGKTDQSRQGRLLRDS